MKSETKKQAIPRKQFMGIADAHGIESFLPYESKGFGYYVMRAQLNRQRHAVAYVAEVDWQTEIDVNTEIAMQKFEQALRVLKQRAYTLGFPTDYQKQYKISWEMIPNPELDPWWSP